MKPTLKPHYFDEIYARNNDPWNFESKPYEHQKYAATLDHLPRERYQSALELGCSIGVFTAMLAPRCARLLALDVAEIPLQKARARCADFPHVEFRRATLPGEFPDGNFDLMVMSEVGYYFAMPDLRALQTRIRRALQPGGDLVLVHYLPDVPDYPLSGDEVHDAFFGVDELEHLSGFRSERYRFDAWRRRESG